MKIFIDTAKIDEIKKFSYLIDGVTTNPSLIKSALDESTNMEEHIREICKTAGGGRPVSLEVISTDSENMIKEAEKLYRKFNAEGNVVIKIPVSTSTNQEENFYGLTAIKALSSKGIPVNATLVMTPEQAFLAAKMGARYVSPFSGRVDDFIRKNIGMSFDKGDYFPAEGMSKAGLIASDNGICSGVDLVRKTVNIFNNYKIKCEIIAASLRNARQAREVAEAGSHIATIPFNVLISMIKHPKTVEGIIKFSDDIVDEYRDIFG